MSLFLEVRKGRLGGVEGHHGQYRSKNRPTWGADREDNGLIQFPTVVPRLLFWAYPWPLSNWRGARSPRVE